MDGKTSSNKILWNWYANHYDVLLHFTPYTNLINKIASEVNSISRSGKVLEVGVGTGNIINILAENQNYDITGIDSSPVMLNIANKKLDGKKVKLIQRDLNENWAYSISDSYDIIIVNNVLYSLNNFKDALMQIASKLNNNGAILISEPLTNSSTGKLFIDFIRHHPPNSLKKILFHAIPFLGLLIANLIIAVKENTKHYVFFSEKDITDTLQLNGIRVLKTELIYNRQNILTVGIKE